MCIIQEIGARCTYLSEPISQDKGFLIDILKIGMQKKYNGFPANSLLYAKYAK